MAVGFGLQATLRAAEDGRAFPVTFCLYSTFSMKKQHKVLYIEKQNKTNDIKISM